MKQEQQASRLIGPEDVKPGEYVTVSRETLELLPEACGSSCREQARPMRVQIMPDWAGYPLKVVAVCVPYVLVKAPTGQHLPLDLRRQRMARLSEHFGKQAFKSMKPAKCEEPKKKRKRKDKKKKK